MNSRLQTKRVWRLVLLCAGAAAMAAGLWTGLARLGLSLPGGTPALAGFHGVLMIAGFLGTVISLERAVAVGRWWAYSAPAFSAAGAVTLIIGMPALSGYAFIAGSLALVAASGFIVFRQPALFTVMLCAGAVCWLVGSALWSSGRPMTEVDGWWLAFLILTIAAERVELSRLLTPPLASQVAVGAIAALVIVGALRDEFGQGPASFAGLGLIGLALWLLQHDVALRTIRGSGQTRFSAACMLAGYAWLMVAGLLLLLVPPGAASFSFDAVIHSITIGFVLSMIFGHAPIILPAVIGARVRFAGAAYGALALLHLSALLRVGGDLFEWIGVRNGSAFLTIVALAAYALVLLVASRK